MELVTLAEQLKDGGLIVILIAFSVYMIKQVAKMFDKIESLSKESNLVIKENAVALTELKTVICENAETTKKTSEVLVSAIQNNTMTLEFFKQVDNFMNGRKKDEGNS